MEWKAISHIRLNPSREVATTKTPSTDRARKASMTDRAEVRCAEKRLGQEQPPFTGALCYSLGSLDSYLSNNLCVYSSYGLYLGRAQTVLRCRQVEKAVLG